MDLSERNSEGAGERHPWEVARAAYLLQILDDAGAFTGGRRILDVGSGDAWLALQLLERAPEAQVTCWDLHYTEEDIAALQSKRLHPTREAPAPPFDLGLLLDVIEHVEDDVALLRTVVERLPAGGQVLVSVPAWPALFSSHDVALRHHRRYTPQACRDAMIASGLVVEKSGGFFHALVVPRALHVMRDRLVGAPKQEHGVGRWAAGRTVTRAMVGVLRAEQTLSRAANRLGFDLPGLSFWALGRKP